MKFYITNPEMFSLIFKAVLFLLAVSAVALIVYSVNKQYKDDPVSKKWAWKVWITLLLGSLGGYFLGYNTCNGKWKNTISDSVSSQHQKTSPSMKETLGELVYDSFMQKTGKGNITPLDSQLDSILANEFKTWTQQEKMGFLVFFLVNYGESFIGQVLMQGAQDNALLENVKYHLEFMHDNLPNHAPKLTREKIHALIELANKYQSLKNTPNR